MKYPDFDIENKFRDTHGIIAGIDEAGRGALAGPVVAAAVYIENPVPVANLPVNDSKKLSRRTREELFGILSENIYWGIGIIENDIIDRINILQATFAAMLAAVSHLEQKMGKKVGHLLIDGNRIPDSGYSADCFIGGDGKIFSIAAASIIAKVSRDRIMTEHSKRYPEYKLLKNKGYGTKEHIDNILRSGATEIHRRSFLTKILDNQIKLFT